MTLPQDSPLVAAVRSAFSTSGPLAQAGADFVPREVQTEMAIGVARAIDERTALVVEAGTGIGKTFGYLVPALLSGQRTLVSTATKSLQDQLFHRDLPALRRALGVSATAALLKGRASYLCPHRLKLARQDALLNDRQAVRMLAKIEAWAPATSTGDLSEVPGLEERSSVLPLVTSTRDNCLGGECPELSGCHVVRARRAALAADLVVVNHHLFFADMAVRESGLAELLPTVDVVVFDEAHQLVSAGVQFLGSVLASGALADLGRDVSMAGMEWARGMAQWALLGSALERSGRELREACLGHRPASPVTTVRLKWQECAGTPDFREALGGVELAAAAAGEALAMVVGAAPDFARLLQRVAEVRDRVRQFSESAGTDRVRWIDISAHHVRLIESPLDIREAFTSRVEARDKAWVFTSATLGDDEALSWFVRPAGLEAASVMQLSSPFDYPNQARLYIPRRFAQPNEPDHAYEVAELASRFARRLGGRTFVLTTTLRALRAISEALRDAQVDEGRASDAPLQVLVQGHSPKRMLLQQFLANPRSVLVGSHSFWEGIDVPGDALQCVIIDKLPFPPPGDPIVEARAAAIRGRGGDPFNEYFVAETAVALKQGAGRLIRSPADRGLLVVCDPRLLQQRYGRRLIAALPPATRISDEADVLDYLESITTGATSASRESEHLQ